jgi:hypothetical protein
MNQQMRRQMLDRGRVAVASPPPTRYPDDRRDVIWGFWLRLSVAPHDENQKMTMADRDRYRRSRLLSTLQLSAIILTAILLPRGLYPVFDLGTIVGVIAFAVILVISIVLNRLGFWQVATFIFVFGLAASIAGSQLFTATGKIQFEDLAGYDLFVIPIIITGMLMPRRVLLEMWLGCVIYTIVDLALAEHGPSLDQYLLRVKDTPTFLRAYPVAIYPVILMSIVAVISWLVAVSVERAIREEDRTADLEEAYQLLSQQNQELEAAIASLQQVHTSVANGDLSVRAPTNRDNVLLPLAASLNLMLERLSRSAGAQAMLMNLEQHITTLSLYVEELSRGNFAVAIPQTPSGLLSAVATNLDQLRTGVLTMINSSLTMIDQIVNDTKQIQVDIEHVTQSTQVDPETAERLRQLLAHLDQQSSVLKQYLGQVVTH